MTETFQDIGVRTRTAASLSAAGYITPNAVQRDAIPSLLAGIDCVIQAPTGSGKTLAFVVPMVERFAGHHGHGARGLILVPTRELATQVAAVIRQVDRGLRTVVLMGGVGYGSQLAGLRNAPDVIVACPGRLLDLAGRGDARLGKIEYLVLDEADEMLDQGFARDVEQIIALCPQAGSGASRQRILASATMPEWVLRMITKHLRSPLRVQGERTQEPLLEHGLMTVTCDTKVHTLSQLLRRQRAAGQNQTIVFHRTKHGVKKLARDLASRGHFTAELQGNLSQNARDRALDSFRRNDAEVLVATNVAARGIDVVNVGLVVNFELPETPQWLTHRVGRTARNGAEGKAITFFSEHDTSQWRKLRSLGAPPLHRLDGERLLESGEWILGEPHEPVAAVSAGRRSSRSKRTASVRRPRTGTERSRKRPSAHSQGARASSDGPVQNRHRLQ
ncbi:MAG: DEAD/DEAH box helicase [Candidatus Dormibacteraeota bacterium]|nr:DEAD/DEAH box helicase [Candidatus Dormibacteraeota bacterium]